MVRPLLHSWSSYRANSQGEDSKLIQANDLYTRLGPDAPNRQSAYRELFRHELDPGVVDEIRQATNGNVVLGNKRFSEEIATLLDRRVIKGKAGRPRKPLDEGNL